MVITVRDGPGVQRAAVLFVTVLTVLYVSVLQVSVLHVTVLDVTVLHVIVLTVADCGRCTRVTPVRQSRAPDAASPPAIRDLCHCRCAARSHSVQPAPDALEQSRARVIVG